MPCVEIVKIIQDGLQFLWGTVTDMQLRNFMLISTSLILHGKFNLLLMSRSWLKNQTDFMVIDLEKAKGPFKIYRYSNTGAVGCLKIPATVFKSIEDSIVIDSYFYADFFLQQGNITQPKIDTIALAGVNNLGFILIEVLIMAKG